jgi:hypothetical protein
MAHPISPSSLLVLSSKYITPCFLCGYTFNIANQTTSALEDEMNKPHRPILSKLFSMRQAHQGGFLRGLLVLFCCIRFSENWQPLTSSFSRLMLHFFYVWPNFNIGSVAMLSSYLQHSLCSGLKMRLFPGPFLS